MTERDQPSTARPAAEVGRPVVLQVLPRLVTGGAERGAVDIAVTLAEAGGTSLVASEGGPMEYELKRAGIAHVKLPLASKNPVVMYRNIARLAGLQRRSYNVPAHPTIPPSTGITTPVT